MLAIASILMAIGLQGKTVFAPLEQLRRAMEQYSTGDLDVRLPERENVSQIGQLYQTFNHMADQIQILRIDVYEKELERQRARSRFLQVQIQPHFYTNILNLIHGMAQIQDFEEIQKLCRVSAAYFRYLMGQKGTFVPLKEELRCLTSYIEIQHCRYKDMLEIQVNVEPEMEDEMILPLVIQTFVGNSVKHNIMLVPHLEIELTVKREGEHDLLILIEDNGLGFKKEILDKINRNESIEEEGEHIGIQNNSRKKGAKMNLLLVDDEIAMLHIMEKAIDWKKKGIQKVFTAYNTDLARDIISSSKIDLVICDIEMPKENGLSLIQWIQDMYPEIINIILTGYPDFNYARSAISLGVYRYLLKPIAFDELEETIASAVEKLEEYKTKNKPEADPEIADAVNTIKKYLESHYSEVITRKKIEELVHLNQDHINREFKKQTGYTLMEYVQHYRILMAKKMLRETTLSISEISIRTGYDSPAYFSKIFKKQTERTPLEYRAAKAKG